MFAAFGRFGLFLPDFVPHSPNWGEFDSSANFKNDFW
jgi:hypothetical protein